MNPSNDLYERAWALVELGRPAKAIPLFKQCLSIDPDDVAALCGLSHAYTSSGNAKQGLEYANRAILSDPEEAECHRIRSYALGELSRFDEALESARCAVEVDPWSEACLTHLVLLQVACEHLTDAESTASRLLELNPESVDAYLALGMIHRDRQQYAECIDACNRALSIDPECTAAMTTLGQARDLLSEKEEALKIFHRAVETEPDNASAQDHLRRQAEECGYSSVEEYLAARTGGDNEAHIERCREMRQSAQFTMSVSTVLSSNFIPLGLGRGIARFVASLAAQELAELVALAPHDLKSFLRLSEAWIAAGNPLEAVHAANRAIELQPSSWISLRWKGWALWRLSLRTVTYRRRAQVLRDVWDVLNASIEASDHNAFCYETLCALECASAKHDSKRFEAAVALAQGLVDRDPTDYYALQIRGDVAAAQGRWNEAEKIYRLSYEYQPKSALVADRIAQALWRQGKVRTALTQIRRVSEIDPEYNPWFRRFFRLNNLFPNADTCLPE